MGSGIQISVQEMQTLMTTSSEVSRARFIDSHSSIHKDQCLIDMKILQSYISQIHERLASYTGIIRILPRLGISALGSQKS
jgi:hypothetical protein